MASATVAATSSTASPASSSCSAACSAACGSSAESIRPVASSQRLWMPGAAPVHQRVAGGAGGAPVAADALGTFASSCAIQQ
eukprot:6481564-Prymnesium_polylepis.2